MESQGVELALEGVAFGLPATIWVVARGWRDPAARRGVAAFAAGGGAVIGLLLAYNWIQHGSPTLFGFELQWGPEHGLGFHEAPWGPPHTFLRGVQLLNGYLLALQLLFFDAPAPSLLLALAGLFLARRLDPLDRYLLAGSALVLLGLSVSFAGFDWIMSLEPLWFSTMFGVYQFAGVFVSALAALVVLTAWLKRTGAGCADVGEKQLHDLGKLLFGFSCFWMYIWFSQYMLIWYVNIPEESVYFIRRTQGLWWPVMLLNLALNWGIPFFALLPRPAKRSWRVMVRISLVILAGRWLDLYLMVLPPLSGDQPACGFAELGGLLLVAGLVTLFLTGGLKASEAGRTEPWGEPAQAG